MKRFIGSVCGVNGFVSLHNLFFADANSPEEAFGIFKREALRLGYINPHIASIISVDNILNANSKKDVLEYVYE